MNLTVSGWVWLWLTECELRWMSLNVSDWVLMWVTKSDCEWISLSVWLCLFPAFLLPDSTTIQLSTWSLHWPVSGWFLSVHPLLCWYQKHCPLSASPCIDVWEILSFQCIPLYWYHKPCPRYAQHVHVLLAHIFKSKPWMSNCSTTVCPHRGCSLEYTILHGKLLHYTLSQQCVHYTLWSMWLHFTISHCLAFQENTDIIR